MMSETADNVNCREGASGFFKRTGAAAFFFLKYNFMETTIGTGWNGKVSGEDRN